MDEETVNKLLKLLGGINFYTDRKTDKSRNQKNVTEAYNILFDIKSKLNSKKEK